MSRIGRKPILVPEKVKIELQNGTISVNGPKGNLSLKLPPSINVEVKEKEIIIKREGEDKKTKSLHGTFRALINNMVIGVTQGFKKELEIVGIGYKAQLKGTNLVLQLGFSHPVEVPIPSDLKVTLGGTNKITIEGIDKQKVGQFAAQIRAIYPPEPYKGKGIRYVQEIVRKKLGKAMAK
ncbi:MAG: 50S ribosomal protein L6 [Candidatus Omnitrophota bacterium]|nr:MAG: 50S ribosomal protein L6 [Candidatus Omnitrophota bacterium]RKY45139.1 MAG: 50S ribosomal protein L6 [Candidatus Omnitrophota bacterium]